MPTVHLTLAPELQHDPTGRQITEAATEKLRGMPGADELFADWTVARGAGAERRLVLTLRTPPAAVTVAYSPAELFGHGGRARMSYAYHRLLSALIQRSLADWQPASDRVADPEEQLAKAD